jgi:hypothetical protein
MSRVGAYQSPEFGANCFTATRCLDEVVRFRIARVINERILQRDAEGGVR